MRLASKKKMGKNSNGFIPGIPMKRRMGSGWMWKEGPCGGLIGSLVTLIITQNMTVPFTEVNSLYKQASLICNGTASVLSLPVPYVN